MMNYRLVAIQVGDLIKYNSSTNEINRAAKSIFNFSVQPFPEKDSITSERASLFYDWVMTLAKQRMGNNECRNELLLKFCKIIIADDQEEKLEEILNEANIRTPRRELLNEFNSRSFHEQVHKHCKDLYRDEHYFHAVFEASKAYNKLVKVKAQETKDGHSLMMAVWGPDGVLKITNCETETDHSIQNGIKFLSAGLMQAVRNPTAHEPAVEWPISKDDCLNILSFMSFLFKKLDEAAYFQEQK